ncbi:MAG TPA: hypothetical protein VGD34_09770 [Kribbella sp.]|jgi:hypothetical protein
MMVLGIVLIVLAVLLGLGISVSSSDSTTMSVFGVDFGVVVPTVFFLGAAAGIALALGLWLTKKGLSRGYRRRKEVKELRQQVAAAPSTDTEPVAEGSSDDTAPPETSATRTVEVDEGDRLAAERHTVADGTDTKQPH